MARRTFKPGFSPSLLVWSQIGRFCTDLRRTAGVQVLVRVKASGIPGVTPIRRALHPILWWLSVLPDLLTPHRHCVESSRSQGFTPAAGLLCRLRRGCDRKSCRGDLRKAVDALGVSERGVGAFLGRALRGNMPKLPIFEQQRHFEKKRNFKNPGFSNTLFFGTSRVVSYPTAPSERRAAEKLHVSGKSRISLIFLKSSFDSISTRIRR